MRPSSAKAAWIGLLVLAVGSAWISPFGRELTVGDETKYSRVVWEMADSDEVLVPRLEGEPYAHKPPLHFWILTLLSHVFGLGSTWTYVLPSLLFFLVLNWLTAVVATRIAGMQRGLIASALFSTFWLAWVVAQTARMDMMFVAAITAGAILIFEHFEHGKRGSVVTAGLLFGIAILVKGPMGGVIGIVLFSIERFRRRHSTERRGWVEPLLALLAILVVPLIWLVPAIFAGGGDYGRELLVDQSLGRAFQSWV
ncbi:MAG: glycosyltransferase family 39 protein, partial [Thermoanaerobaculia bacterium]|nr:glycosyltransferase family 39 protein [Thermoanaerobaculia bacterium]